MEDGSVPEVTGYYNNLAVTCTNALGQSVPMGCKPEGTRVVCEPLKPYTCEAVTVYKASVCSKHRRRFNVSAPERAASETAGLWMVVVVFDQHLILTSI